MEGFGIFGIAIRGQIPDFVSLHISNIMLITGIALEIYAITIFKGDPKKGLIIALSNITIVDAILYPIFLETYIIRSIVVSIAAGIITLIGRINL